MTKNLILWLGLIWIIGCSFQNSRQFDLYYPASVKIYNYSEFKIELESIYSLPDAEGTFILNGGRVTKSTPLVLQISEASYETFLKKTFIIEGICNNKTFKKYGEDLDVEFVGDWEVKIIFTSCH